MNFQAINIQRKLMLIAGALGVISVFLPWISVSMMGMSNSLSGFRGTGIVVFLTFAAAIIVALTGDQSKTLDSKMWLAAIAAGVIALLFTIISFGTISNEFGEGFGIVDAGYGIGIYLALISALGITAVAWLYRNPDYNIQKSISGLKEEFSSRSSTSVNNRVSDLERLIEMRQQGKITEEEYQQLKSKII